MPTAKKEKPSEKQASDEKATDEKSHGEKVADEKDHGENAPVDKGHGKKVAGEKDHVEKGSDEKEAKEKASTKKAQTAKRTTKPRKTRVKKKTDTPEKLTQDSSGSPRSFKDFNPWDKIVRPPKPVEEYTNKEVGREGEKLAALYLEYKGYHIITLNWTSRMGEVDIVARQGDTLVLCEVKTRVCLEEKNVFPELKVDAAKQKKYRQLALQYLIEHPEEDSVRFDVIALVITGQQNARLRHLINAFCFDAEG